MDGTDANLVEEWTDELEGCLQAAEHPPLAVVEVNYPSAPESPPSEPNLGSVRAHLSRTIHLVCVELRQEADKRSEAGERFLGREFEPRWVAKAAQNPACSRAWRCR